MIPATLAVLARRNNVRLEAVHSSRVGYFGHRPRRAVAAGRAVFQCALVGVDTARCDGGRHRAAGRSSAACRHPIRLEVVRLRVVIQKCRHCRAIAAAPTAPRQQQPPSEQQRNARPAVEHPDKPQPETAEPKKTHTDAALADKGELPATKSQAPPPQSHPDETPDQPNAADDRRPVRAAGVPRIGRLRRTVGSS